MKFSTREDIDAPIEAVFELLCEFETYERAAMRRGADVRRRDNTPINDLGTTWDVRFMLRGKERDLAVEVTRFEPPTDVVIDLSSRNLTGCAVCELFALSRNRTRMTCVIEVRPLTLPARLMIQSLQLTKSSLNRQYKERVAQFARDAETRYGNQA